MSVTVLDLSEKDCVSKEQNLVKQGLNLEEV